ncbi:acyltransferase family-domain-containing protein [Xylariaceae sp. FL0594]|nr:acyltransferase family-domain-containing protein [Xylariaceae sp. FL0594]
MPVTTEEERRSAGLFTEGRSLMGSDHDSERSGGGPGGGGSGVATTRAYLNLLRPSAWAMIARRTVDFLLPSFLTGSGSSGAKKLYPTAYLDGMRGLAALFVFFCHYFYTAFFIAEGYRWFDPLVHGGSGSGGGGGGAAAKTDAEHLPPPPAVSTYTSLWRLPFVRLLYSGPSMVCVFFVISGYALSCRPLQLSSRAAAANRNRPVVSSHHTINKNNHTNSAGTTEEASFSRTLSSLVFRRFFRLYLPPFISTLCMALLTRWGAFEGTRAFTTDRRYVRNVIEHHPPWMDTMGAQLAHWAGQMWDFVHVWAWQTHGGSTQYDVHLWTIPVEFRCSMVLFLVLLGTSRLRPYVRSLVVGVIAWFVIRSDRWEMFLFLAGMTIADLDVRRGAHEQKQGQVERKRRSGSHDLLLLPLSEKKVDEDVDTGSSSSSPSSSPTSTPSSSSPLSTRSERFWTLMCIPCLYLLSSPDAGPFNVPGYSFLGPLIPGWFSEKYRFWQMLSAAAFVFCAARSARCRRFFELRPVQYAGRISYAIYLCHGPVTHLVGYPVQRWAWRAVTGIDTEGAYKRGVVLAACINIPLVVWAADVFWRAVDVPTVKFAKWLESKVVVD